jgi:aspartyl aminopeptidase
MRASEKYRAFISYSHSDRSIAEQVARILEKNGIDPLWDKNFLFGTEYKGTGI